LTYSITLTITGGTVQNVQVTDGVVTDLVFLGMGPTPAGGSGYYDGAARNMSWNFPNLTVGTYMFTYRVQVDNSPYDPPCGTILTDNAQMTYAGLTGTADAAATVTIQCSSPTPTPATEPVSTPVCYPNPSNGGPVQVQVNLGDFNPEVRFQIFTTAFRKVREDVFTNVPAGVLSDSLEMRDQRGSPLAGGLYYVVVTAGSHRSTGKILVIR